MLDSLIRSRSSSFLRLRAATNAIRELVSFHGAFNCWRGPRALTINATFESPVIFIVARYLRFYDRVVIECRVRNNHYGNGPAYLSRKFLIISLKRFLQGSSWLALVISPSHWVCKRRLQWSPDDRWYNFSDSATITARGALELRIWTHLGIGRKYKL